MVQRAVFVTRKRESQLWDLVFFALTTFKRCSSVRPFYEALQTRVALQSSVTVSHDGEKDGCQQSQDTFTQDESKQEIKSEKSIRQEDDDVSSHTLPAEDDVEKNDAAKDEAPDGGYGWFIVLGAFLVQISSYGMTSSCLYETTLIIVSQTKGVMQDYYEREVFGDKVSNAAFQLSFVGTLISVFANLMGPLATILLSYFGTKVVLILGTLFIAIGLFMAGFATEIFHLYLTQGLSYGIGMCFMYITIMGVAPQYFNRKRGLALGIIASGSGIGGLIFPFVMTPINNSLGAGWTYRVLGFIVLACDIIAVILVKDRIKRPLFQKKKLSDILKFDVFKHPPYRIWALAATIQLMPYFVPFYYLPSYATWLGLSDKQGSALVAVTSAMNFVGRIICGFVSDRIGPINTDILYLTLACLANFLIWTFAYSYGVLMAFAAVFGLVCGSYFTLVSPLTASILGMEKFPTGLSFVILFNVISIFGINISNAIEDATSAEPFFAYKMFAGSIYAASVLLMLWLKFTVNRKVFVKV
ncbi:hypothetical protein O0I10_007376 [Lichtheimia ornata]|uniref:Major facilitator superfamily (MFS) profile domain-containing protein n=1 Tax=Lichtheimia ornata TaxID=688661 RepID=A0AAD7V0T8_9FUNG|nr:uncharacterized protein O0I10_007376 [Lichtheimia ornata]KAJ8657042.1 hypothetical protein O0I10_007376 [Lichtheimia ornata]